jgi:hypothetical protein
LPSASERITASLPTALQACRFASWAGSPQHSSTCGPDSRSREASNPFNISYALLSETVAHWMRDDLEAERKAAAELVAVSEEQGLTSSPASGECAAERRGR